jgi:hypothetical protein
MSAQGSEQIQNQTQEEVQQEQVNKRTVKKTKKKQKQSQVEVDNFDLNQLPAEKKELYRQMMESEIRVQKQKAAEESFIIRTYVNQDKIEELTGYFNEQIKELKLSGTKNLRLVHVLISKIFQQKKIFDRESGYTTVEIAKALKNAFDEIDPNIKEIDVQKMRGKVESAIRTAQKHGIPIRGLKVGKKNRFFLMVDEKDRTEQLAIIEQRIDSAFTSYDKFELEGEKIKTRQTEEKKVVVLPSGEEIEESEQKKENKEQEEEQ